ncbi:hypothetical protein [uncultured Roseovarius sp.]|uniref:hypothetical protein n=1 Tax=uncultured Roseovarius sp. TaxID=293344 RepID=UPI002597AE0A|nr:hypothetical protein [uncultured Roseovarius sp.]
MVKHTCISYSLTEHVGAVKRDPSSQGPDTLAGGSLLDAPGTFRRIIQWFDNWLMHGRKIPLMFWLILFALPGLLVWVKLIAGWVK